MKNLEIRIYGKRELARLYFPKTKTEKVALNNLKLWIKGNTELTEALLACGRAKCAQRYFPEEVTLIIYYLGEP